MVEAMFSMGDYLLHGASGLVERQEEVVIKRPYPNHASSLPGLKIEARIFNHLGSHPRVVRFLSWVYEHSISRNEYPRNGNLRIFISSDQPSSQEKLRWIKQAGEAIQALYNKTKMSD
jgi:hypothetical protein